MANRVIEPAQGVVLVKLPASDYGDVIVPEKEYSSVTWGEIVAANPNDHIKLGHIAHWRQFKDDCRIPGDDAIYALIEIKDILGTSRNE